MRGAFLAAVAVLLTAFLPACQKDHAQHMLVVGATIVSPETNCTPEAGTKKFLSSGILDLAVTNQYWLFPTVRNVMPTIAEMTGESAKQLTFETNTLSIVKADVHLDLGMFDDGVDPFLGSFVESGFSWPVAATVAPNEEAAFPVQVIPPELGNYLDTKMVTWVKADYRRPAVWITARVKIEALTQDRWPVASNEFAFPLLVCWQCTIQCCSLSQDPKPTGKEDLSCLPGQDAPMCDSICPVYSYHYQDYLQAQSNPAPSTQDFVKSVSGKLVPINPCSVCPEL